MKIKRQIIRIKYSWNSIYGYERTIKGRSKPIIKRRIRFNRSKVRVIESQNLSKNGLKDITLDGKDMLYFPVDSYKDFTMWNALSTNNCDGVVLYGDDRGKVIIKILELKSAFDTSEYYKASKQIVISLQKILLLLNCIPSWKKVKDVSIEGCIFSLEPDLDKMNWIEKMDLLPKDKWSYCDRLGLSLAIDNKYEINIPSDIIIPGIPNNIGLKRIWCKNESNNVFDVTSI